MPGDPVERREMLTRPGNMRRRYDPQSQRPMFAQSRPNKTSWEKIAEIDAELTHRANRIEQTDKIIKEGEVPEAPEEGEVQSDENTVDTEEDNVIMRGNNLPIVELSNHHIDRKEADGYTN